ncbi:alpha/beta hydrolase [Sphingomonas oleivorans]|uniref:Alpha/beta hydrolase n=1 Tax=Sphingomonas oleivorans TaxID=1735121 RepID=A0A2T5FZ28_9SPHN|nr:alpha/beta hydrolase [Sphingomonas oleivorans]PTQ11862.1 alpha/beta hydrolase [Sphingomonas oleivorans]
MHRIAHSLALATLWLAGPASAYAKEQEAKPTIILVHGAFADSSGWNDVIARLEKKGYPVIAAANPLRGVASDANSISAIVRSVSGQVVLVGHSYGGAVITEAAHGNSNVKALIYVAGFLPEAGESSLSLSGKFPGSTLGQALMSVSLPDGTTDLYIRSAKFHDQFAADVPPARTALMAATQRPVSQAALAEPSRTAMWKSLPSYVIYGSSDRNIPAAAMKFMADRAHARKTVVIANASHALMVSRPTEVAAIIEEAASAD